MLTKTIKFSDGQAVEIHSDEDPQNPRDWDNLSVMAFFHDRYNIGDKDHGIDHKDFCGWEEMREWIERKMDGAIIVPVRMYDHSGIAFAMPEPLVRGQVMPSLGPEGNYSYPFTCPWDSGQVGFMYVTRAKLIEEYGNDGEEARQKALNCMKGELEVYNQYVGNDVWGYIFRDKPCETCGGEGEETDSCWGFFGDDPLENGMSDNWDTKYADALKAFGGILDLPLSDDAVKVVEVNESS